MPIQLMTLQKGTPSDMLKTLTKSVISKVTHNECFCQFYISNKKKCHWFQPWVLLLREGTGDLEYSHSWQPWYLIKALTIRRTDFFAVLDQYLESYILNHLGPIPTS